jgi:pyruvate kinase
MIFNKTKIIATVMIFAGADTLMVTEKTLKNKKLIKPGKRYVITGGFPVDIPGTTNYLTILKV